MKQDLEGLQTMRILGENMAWLIKSKYASTNAGIHTPTYETMIATNFIR